MNTSTSDCPFCNIESETLVLQTEGAYVVEDAYPVSLGHCLVVPRKHVKTLFELPRHDQLALWDVVERLRTRLVEQHEPDGFNIGLNDGAAAGQTVPHVQIHVIPRYQGDVPDMRGGIRWVIPDKAAYWR